MSPMAILLALLLNIGPLNASEPVAAGQEHKPQAKWSLVKPSDLGPEKINFRDYPSDLRHVGEFVIKERCMRCHTQARIWSAPIIELSDEAASMEKKRNPGLFADPRLAVVGDDVWVRYIKRMQSLPACCGGCSDMNEWEVKDLLRFLRYDSIKRKTGDAAPAFLSHRKKLIREYVRRKPESAGEFGGIAGAPSPAVHPKEGK